MFGQEDIVQKRTIEAKIVLSDGTGLTGCFFINQGQRLVDLLNDQRAFIPYRNTNGTFLLIRKSTIDRIEPVDQTSTSKKKTPQWLGR